MKYYLDITLLPGADIGLYFLWGKVFSRIHLILAARTDSNGRGQVGISLPGYDLVNHSLGEKLRLLAPVERDLEKLEVADCLAPLADYVHITSIREVPARIEGYARYRRQQPKSSNTRMARRKAKREGIKYEDAMRLISDREEKLVETPYINMHSQSTDNRFKLFILQDFSDKPIFDGFSSYGLSPVSTVPLF